MRLTHLSTIQIGIPCLILVSGVRYPLFCGMYLWSLFINWPICIIYFPCPVPKVEGTVFGWKSNICYFDDKLVHWKYIMDILWLSYILRCYVLHLSFCLGLPEFLMDKAVEPNQECRNTKYDIVAKLSRSPSAKHIFGEGLSKLFQEHFREGPYFFRSQADVAMESRQW